jgi:hypothetical protein
VACTIGSPRAFKKINNIYGIINIENGRMELELGVSVIREKLTRKNIAKFAYVRSSN